MRARALRAPVILGSWTRQTGAVRPRPSQLRCSPKINYFQKQNAFLQAQTRAARGVYLSTGLIYTLLSYTAPYWATMHPPELRCTLLSYTAPFWAMLHPIWATLHPSELSCTLLNYTAPFWAMLHPIWAKLHPLDKLRALLSYDAPDLS
jgi:hypothetical protein